MRNINYLKENGVDVDKSLELFGDINTYNSTLGELVVSLKDKLNKLTNYKDNKDMYNYSLYSHSIKSDAKNFGFTKLGDIAYENESKSSIGDVYYVESNFNEFKNEIDKTVNIINNYFSDSKEVVQEVKSDKNLELNKNSILVVDDSNIIRNFVKRIFQDKYEIVDAKDGLEAINVISSNINNDYIECILLDLNMPKVDGFKVLDFMKEKDLLKKFPVSIISGDNTKETIDKAFTYDIVDMIEKPFNEQSIKTIVEKTMYVKEINK